MARPADQDPPDEAPRDPAAELPGGDEPRAREIVGSPEARVLDPSRRWERPLAVEPALPRSLGAEPRIHVDPGAWGAGYLAVHERELPPELLADLRECVPQAHLRDLHRPVTSFHAELEPLGGGRPVAALDDAMAEARAARSREPLPVVEPGEAAMRTEQERRRALHAETWQPILPDDAERRPVVVFPSFDE
jgi:hypothetical protein